MSVTKSSTSYRTSLPPSSVQVYKFDKGYQNSRPKFWKPIKRINMTKKHSKNIYRKICEYVQLIEKVIEIELPWEMEFFGENVGDGISGSMDEKRLIV